MTLQSRGGAALAPGYLPLAPPGRCCAGPRLPSERPSGAGPRKTLTHTPVNHVMDSWRLSWYNGVDRPIGRLASQRASRSPPGRLRITLKPSWNSYATALLAALAALPAPAPAQRLLGAPAAGSGFSGAVLRWNRSSSFPGSSNAIPSQVVVRFRGDITSARRDQLVNTFGCQIARVDPNSGYALVSVRDNRAADLIGLLTQQPEVLHAEPSYRLYALDASLYNPFEWYLFDRGTLSGHARSNFGVQAPSAWMHTKGAGVTVAVVDTGAAFENYSDFSEAPALSLTHFAPGYDILNNTDHPDDDNSHGTLVAGVLASNLVNGGGVVGVAPDVTLMPVKAMGANGSGTDYDIAAGIRWAADNGAQVINLSLGNSQAGPVLADAVNYAADKNCVLVAAAGNEGQTQGSNPAIDYPAAYTNCIAVGATGFNGARAPYSNRGRNLALVAPGGNATQDLNGDGQPDGIVGQTFDPTQGYGSFGYAFWDGTSAASPMVAGVAALVLAANPEPERRRGPQHPPEHRAAPGHHRPEHLLRLRPGRRRRRRRRGPGAGGGEWRIGDFGSIQNSAHPISRIRIGRRALGRLSGLRWQDWARIGFSPISSASAWRARAARSASGRASQRASKAASAAAACWARVCSFSRRWRAFARCSVCWRAANQRGGAGHSSSMARRSAPAGLLIVSRYGQ